MNMVYEYIVPVAIENSPFKLVLYFYEGPDFWELDELESTWNGGEKIPEIVLNILKERKNDKKITNALKNRIREVDEKTKLDAQLSAINR
jgi:hypothetical protein